MKFIYIDESGSRDQGDVFVMCGLMVDAYPLCQGSCRLL
jgi:hypothetical protein